MPDVTTSVTIKKDISVVWDELKSLNSLSNLEKEISLTVLEEDESHKIFSWRMYIGRDDICWKEKAVFEHSSYKIRFEQLEESVFETLKGYWQLRKSADDAVTMTLVAHMEFGLESLAEIYNDMAQNLYFQYFSSVLQGIKERLEG